MTRRTHSAFASDNQLVLGQLVTEEKSNEITAIPKLLETLAISGCLVTIDAMGCQKAIAEKIMDSGAERKHKCSQCGYIAHRDFNAAQNILALGLDGLGITPRSLRL